MVCINNTLINLYKECWETHNIKLLSTIFHPDIIYNDRDINVFIGLSELTEYWKKNSEKQSNVIFAPIKVLEYGEDITMHWEASFFHTKKNKTKYLKGIIWITTLDKKIKTFTEYFEWRYVND